MSDRASRFPRRLIKRLTDDQRRAVDELRFGSPGPSRRAELKAVLGWKRTREETISYARSLLDDGMIMSAVAARLDVETRYLASLLKKEATTENLPRKPSVHAGKGATNLQTPTGESSRECLPAPAAGFRSFDDLDRWLAERA